MSLGADFLATKERALEDESETWREFARTRGAGLREHLFGLYFPFARSLANRLWRQRNRGDLELAELSQLACTGLLEAIDRFDPARGIPFRAYAARRINGSIVDGLSRLSDAREQLSLRRRIRRERIRSIADGRTAPRSPAEALEALVEAAVGLAIGFMLEDTTLYSADEAASPRQPFNAYESAAWRELVQRLIGEISALPDRERRIVRSHYLEGLTFEQIGGVLGLTKGRISQIHREALGRLRVGLNRRGHFRLER